MSTDSITNANPGTFSLDAGDADAQLRSILEWAVQLLGVEAGEIYLYDPHQLNLKFSVACGPTEKYVGTTLLPGEGLAGKVFSAGRPIIVDDYAAWDGRSPKFEPHPPFKAEVAVPLRWREHTIGVLNIVSDTRQRVITEDDVRAAILCSNLAAVAIENARLYRELSGSLRQLRRTLEQDVAEQTSELARQVALIDRASIAEGDGTPSLSIEEMLTRVMELRITKKVLDGLTRVPLETPSLADLTRRETEILAHIAKGRNNKEIARDLSLALSTVKFHVGSILSKLNLSDRTQAAVWAIRMGLVKQDTSTLGE